MKHDTPALERLLEVMACLRDPEGGCPWDLAQTFETIAPYTLEEAYEVDDAIRRGDMEDLKGELGDLLFQVVFHAQMAAERGIFAFEDVARSIGDKLERRHPHVFADAEYESDEALGEAWEATKARERHQRAEARGGERAGAFADIPLSLPALSRASKLLKRAQRLGGRAPGSTQGCVERVGATLGSLGDDRIEGGVETALGDLLFDVVQLARSLGVDAEGALREANVRFEAEADPER